MWEPGKATTGIHFPSAQKETTHVQQTPAPSLAEDPCKPPPGCQNTALPSQMKLLDLFLGRCSRSFKCNSHSLVKVGLLVPACFLGFTYLAKKHPSLVAGEQRQSLPFPRLPRAPGGEGEEGESPLAGEEVEVKVLCHSGLWGWLGDQGKEEESHGRVWSLWWHSLADLQWSVTALHRQQDGSVSTAKSAWKERSFRHRDNKGQEFWSVVVVTTGRKRLVLTFSAVSQGHGLLTVKVLPLQVIEHSAC